MKVTKKIKRPKFYDYLGAPVETTRVCSHEGCDQPGAYVGGHYTVGTRRVRVWVCKKHTVSNPLVELPVPVDILAGIAAEEAYIKEQEAFYKTHGNFDGGRGVSVKMIASSGHGNSIPGDRVKSWRWE